MKAPVPLQQVLITSRLQLEPEPIRDHDITERILQRIAANMDRGITRVYQTAADCALELTNGSTSGFSMLDVRASGDAMVWAAVSGTSADLLKGEIARQGSPSGFALQQHEPQLFADPGRHYTAMPQFHPPISELLVVPAYDRHGAAFGALWVFVQDRTVKLGRRDAVHLEALVEFMMLACNVKQRLGTA